MTKKQIAFKPELESLLDPNWWAHGLESILNQVDDPIEQSGLDKNIERLIIDPLNKYIQSEWENAGKQHNTGTQAAMNLLTEAEDIVYDLQYGHVHPEDISMMDKKWHQWHAVECFCGWLRAKPFADGPKQPRMDVLHKAMLTTLEELVRKKGKMPSARELWGALPISEKDGIQEKDEYEMIVWKSASGKEKSTSFKSFQSRFTNLKKKFKKK